MPFHRSYFPNIRQNCIGYKNLLTEALHTLYHMNQLFSSR